MIPPNSLRVRPAMKALIASALAATVGITGCSTLPQAGLRPADAPSALPANAAPPDITVASNEIVGPTWQWRSTRLADGGTVDAKAPGRYTLAFQPGGRVLLQVDCNRGSGGYEVNGSAMRFLPAALTRMACPPDSQDGTFVEQLGKVGAYAISGGELTLALRDGGAMRLSRAP